MATELVVLCGKGGVGKTSLALASAFLAARAGRHTLVVSSHPLPELALSVSLRGLRERFPAVAERFFVVHIDQKAVLSRIVLDRIRPGAIAHRLVDSSIYQSFVEIVPGLKEFAFLWKLKELAGKEGSGTGKSYDLIIWDAPATGHFVQTLKVAVNFETYFTGPLAGQARSIGQFLKESHLVIQPVCIPEEMSVDEILELVEELARLGLAPSSVWCNMASPVLSSAPTGSGVLAFPGLTGESTRVLRALLESERREFNRLRSSIQSPIRPVQRIPKGESDLDFLEKLAGCLDGDSPPC